MLLFYNFYCLVTDADDINTFWLFTDVYMSAVAAWLNFHYFSKHVVNGHALLFVTDSVDGEYTVRGIWEQSYLRHRHCPVNGGHFAEYHTSDIGGGI